jgi:outer membrane lipoprotein-sorting protein
MVSIYAYLAKGGTSCRRQGNESLTNHSHPHSHRHPQKRKIILAGFLLFPLLAAFSARADNYEAQFEKWFAAQTNMQMWSANFVETRSLMTLSQPLKSTGKVWVAPGKFRWELGRPPQTIVVRNPDELLILYPRLKHAEIYALDKIPPGPIKDAMALLDVSIPRSRAALEEHFQLLSVAITNSVLQMTLQPKSQSAQQFINSVVMGFHTNDYVIAESQMNFSDGSTLRNDFTDVVFNQDMDPKLFATNVPPNYTVAEPMNR